MMKREEGQYVVYTLDTSEITRAILKYIDDKFPACVSDDAAVTYKMEDGKLHSVKVNNYYPAEEEAT